DPRKVERNDIHIPFADNRQLPGTDSFTCFPITIQYSSLFIVASFRGVQILGTLAFQNPGAECDYLATRVLYRKHYPSRKNAPARVLFREQAAFREEVLCVAFFREEGMQPEGILRRITEVV